jgi:hypothetical protein
MLSRFTRLPPLTQVRAGVEEARAHHQQVMELADHAQREAQVAARNRRENQFPLIVAGSLGLTPAQYREWRRGTGHPG